MKKLFLLLVTVIAVTLCASAQTRTVTGTVLEEGSEEPIIGASVVAGSSRTGVSTDIDGHFAIQVPAGVKTLTVSSVGMHEKTVQITGTNLVIYLSSSVESLDEAIVIAYGKTTKSAYTGSAGVVNAGQLEDALTTNVTGVLSGKVAGVQVLSSNGAPGQSGTVLIRGVGSINAGSSPLYVVDGLPFDGDISTLPNTDIESLTVLKDAASTALYGARGANGVIIITTKRGQSGAAKVNLDMRWGSNSRAIPNYDVITDERQYLEMVYAIHNSTAKRVYGMDNAAAYQYANDNLWKSIGYQTWTAPEGQTMIGHDGKFNPLANRGFVNGEYFYVGDDWAKGTLQHGLRQEYNLSITGGTDRLQYYVSGSYLGDEGIIKGSHFKRFSSRTSVDYQAKSWLKVGTTMNYTYTNTGYPGDNDLDNSTSTGNAFYIANMLAPVYPMYIRDALGQIRYNATNGNPIYDYGDGANYGWGRTNYVRNVMNLSNPTSDLTYNIEEYLSDVFNGKWYATISPISGLDITGTAGYFVDNTRMHYSKNPLYGQSAASKGQNAQKLDRYRTINLQALAQYTRQFGDHGMDILIGAENQSYQVESFYAQGNNLYLFGNYTVNNTIDQKTGGGSVTNIVHRGFFARANYNYANRYFLYASVRRDGSSRFHKDHRWGTFWSASAGWDMSKENFMKPYSNTVDMLKLKFSFGQNGNDQIGSLGLAYPDLYKITGANGVWSDGTLAYKGNTEITWETSNTLNAGVDFSLWKGMLTGTVEYFQRQASDMLFSIPTAPSLGYRSMPMNVGSMRNAGVEIDLGYRPINTKNITLDINANLTLGWNKVIKLDSRILNQGTSYIPNSKQGWLNGSRFYIEGESMYNLYLVDYAGVDEKGNPTWYKLTDKLDENGNVVTAPVRDKNGNIVYKTDEKGQIVKDDLGNPVAETYNVQEETTTTSYTEAYNTNRKITGNLMPKGYGGFGANLQAYGFDLSVAFAYQFGGKILDYTYMDLTNPGLADRIGMNFHKDMLNAWTDENHSDIPALNSVDSSNAANRTSTRYLISSNYVSLNNLTVGYTLPSKLVEKLKLGSVRVYFAGENLALWSKRKGLDPRQSYLTSENSTYSPIRALSGGVKVSF